MLDPALLRGQLDSVAEKLLTRGYELDKVAIEALEAQRKAVQTQTQELQNLRNRVRRRSAWRKARAKIRPR